MQWLEAAILGAIQGLTEFLPVSSSGHLRLVEWQWPSLGEPNPFFEIFLHGVTLLVILVVMRERVWALLKDKRLMGLIVISAIPAALLVKVFKFDDIFKTAGLQFVLCAEIGTGLAILLGERFASAEKRTGAIVAVLLIGLAQGFAVLPGLSRSGLTLAAALILGWKREEAFDFVFLMSLPVIGGACLLEILDVTRGDSQVMFPGWLPLFAGALTAGLFGAWTLVKLRQWVVRGLKPFAYYCLALGCLGLLAGAL